MRAAVAKTMATCEDLASAAAAAGSVPGSNLTVACERFGFNAFEWAERWYVGSSMNASGLRAISGGGGTALPPAGETCEEPPPERTPASA